jgi:nucleoside-diphosphate-sugar epimerase
MKILIIGGDGYIGSYLNQNLPYEITSIDIGWFNEKYSIICDYNSLSEEFISKFDTVILLAAHSSVKMCEGDYTYAFNNNVINFINLLNKIKNINKRIKLIYASSSSVYGATGENIVDETYLSFIPHNNYDITKHVSDLYAEFSGIEYYGLRFGTVNGYSPVMRTDIMINSMVTSAILNNKIDLYVKDTLRPILGIKDLTSAIVKIIEETKDLRGIYNLASFNSTSEKIAYSVSEIINKPVNEKEAGDVIFNSKLQTKNYNFSINCEKFMKNFNFTFKETITTITKSIVENFDSIVLTKRDNIKKYEL